MNPPMISQTTTILLRLPCPCLRCPSSFGPKRIDLLLCPVDGRRIICFRLSDVGKHFFQRLPILFLPTVLHKSLYQLGMPAIGFFPCVLYGLVMPLGIHDAFPVTSEPVNHLQISAVWPHTLRSNDFPMQDALPPLRNHNFNLHSSSIRIFITSMLLLYLAMSLRSIPSSPRK